VQSQPAWNASDFTGCRGYQLIDHITSPLQKQMVRYFVSAGQQGFQRHGRSPMSMSGLAKPGLIERVVRSPGLQPNPSKPSNPSNPSILSSVLNVAGKCARPGEPSWTRFAAREARAGTESMGGEAVES
jgi:hypothetical protein